MPGNGSDGSITIDTELDKTGFDKGSDKLLNAVKDLTSAVDNLGDNMMSSFSQVIPLLSNISSAASRVNGEMTKTATQTADANERVVTSEQQVAQAANQAASAVDRQGSGMSTLVSGATGAQNSISALEREVNSLSSGMSQLSNSAETGFATGNSVLSFDTKLSDMESRLDAARAKLEAFGATKIPTEDYQWLTESLAKAEEQYNKLLERQAKYEDTGVKQNSKAWQSLAYDIQQARAQINDYKGEMAYMEEQGTAFTSGADTEEYARMKSSIDETAASLERNRKLIDSEALAQARLNVQAAQEQVIRAQTAEQKAAAQAQLRDAQQELNDLADSMSNKDTGPSDEAVSGWQKFGGVMKGVGAAAVKVVGTLGKATFKLLSKGVQAATNKLKDYIKQSKQASLTSNALVKSLTSLKRMLITRIKRMFISAIFNEVKEGLKELTKYSAEFDRAMSNIKNSAKGVSGNLTISLGNLISTIEPALTAVLNMLTSAITQFNAFYAALSGKKTVTVAKKQTASYAASLEDAADAAEDVKNQLMGFDKINKLNDDSSKSSGGSDMYEDVPIESTIGEFFTKIKNAFEKGQWNEIGRTIADGLNTGMKTVDDWFNTKLHPLGVTWAGRVADMLNGLTDGFSWSGLGKTIGDGFNTAFDTAYTFLTTYNFLHLGQGVATAINSWFEQTDFSLIGKTLGAKLRAAIDLGFGFVTTLDFENIGQNIADSINGYFEEMGKINPETGLSGWQELGRGIALSLNGIKDAVVTAVKNIDWDEVKKGLGDAISELWGNLDVELKVALVVSLAAITIGSIAKILIEQAVLSKIASSFAKKIAAAFAAEGAAETGAAITESIGTEVAASAGTSSTLLAAGKWIGAALVGAVIGGIVGEGIDKIIGSFDFDGNEYFKNFHWFGDDEYSFIGQAKNVFSNLDVLYDETFGKLGEWLGNGIWSAWESTSQKWTEIKSSVSTKWDEIKTGTSQKWGEIKTAVSDKFTEIKTDVSTSVGNVATTISTKWGEIKTTASEKWAGIKTSISTSWNNIKTDVSTKVGSVATSVSKKWDEIKTSVSTTVGNIATTVSNKWNDIKTTASNKWNDIKTTISTKWDGLKDTLKNTDWTSIGSNLVSGLKSGITNAWDSLKKKVGGLCSDLVSGVKDFFGIASPSKVFAAIGRFLGLGLGEGVDDTKKDVLSTVSNLAQSVTDEMEDTELKPLQLSEDSTVRGLDLVADKLAGIAETFKAITGMLSSMGGLRVPEIAAGRVVPIKTRVDASSTGDTSDMYRGFSLAEWKRALREVLHEYGMDGDIVVPVSLDGDIIYKVVVKKNRDHTIRTGVNALG